jgi:hypothetical protein
MIAPVIKISEVLAKPNGTFVIHVLLFASYFVTGDETLLSATILPLGIGKFVTAGVDVILLNVAVPALNKGNHHLLQADHSPW